MLIVRVQPIRIPCHIVTTTGLAAWLCVVVHSFLEALRRQVVDRIELQGVVLPRLCACSPHLPVLAPHWQHCANNCMYHNNPKVGTRWGRGGHVVSATLNHSVC